MDPITLIGVALAVLAILAALVLEGGSIGSMFLLPAMILVIVGTIGAGAAGSTLRDVKRLPRAMLRAFTAKAPQPDQHVPTIVSMAERARREGLLALDQEISTVSDPFLQRALEMAVDGTDADEIVEILGAEIDAKRAHDDIEAKLFNDMGGYSPTIGIIGAVIGLIHALSDLEDVAALGGNIAGAFVATLWGVMMANVLWIPVANRLRRLTELECEGMELAIEGVLAIQAGSSPRMIARKLQSMVPTDTGGKAVA